MCRAGDRTASNFRRAHDKILKHNVCFRSSSKKTVFYGLNGERGPERQSVLLWRRDAPRRRRHKNVLDSNFSPAYTRLMKKDRLHNAASIIC